MCILFCFVLFFVLFLFLYIYFILFLGGGGQIVSFLDSYALLNILISGFN